MNIVAEISAPTWQPIETAPKDGRFILVFQRGKPTDRAVARWRDGWDNWFASPGNYPWEPTHWMPLPDAPE